MRHGERGGREGKSGRAKRERDRDRDRERQRETETETDRQTDRQTEEQTQRELGKEEAAHTNTLKRSSHLLGREVDIVRGRVHDKLKLLNHRRGLIEVNLCPVSALVTREVPGLDPYGEGRSLIG